MDIREIQLYLHLCDTLHFARTAEQMHVSPSTLSRALQRLEQQAGCRLLERDNRSVRLTRGGEEFRRFAADTLAGWQQLRSRLDPNQQQLRGLLNLYCSVTAAYSHLPALLDRFRREHPLVEIVLNTGDAANAMAEVQQNRADIAIAALQDPFPDSLHFAPMDTIPLTVIGPQIPCRVRELLEEKEIPWDRLPFIVPEHGPGRKRIDNWFKAMGIGANIYAKVSGHEAIVSMVALGCGVSVSPEVVVQHSPMRDRIALLPSPVAIPPFELGCCCKAKRRDDPLIAAFLAAIGSAK
ncbi:HTH-type transcriptional activator IlvY [Shewanella cyperi]|uniref:HTH-type transcriptional activator IlvY n=1 Tax=Shewanella cyperi TaxID=2814292 RepID=UPI001A949F0C|nr:HTH-type transcriptional activator IlvY [Shewanella cyperi]QSX40577.1 HTH-type transcriptional activator IlvY [Shewanella cyperi]